MRRSINRFRRRSRRLNESSVEKAVKTAIQKSEYPKVAKYLDKVVDFVDYIEELIENDEVEDFGDYEGYDVDNLVSYGNSAAKIIAKFPREAEDIAAELDMYDDENDDWTIARTLLSTVADEVIYEAIHRLGY